MFNKRHPLKAAAKRGPPQPGPVKGQRFTAEVRDLNSAGEGVVLHPSGRVFFVKGVWRGERGDFQVLELRGRAGTARLLELQLTAPERIAAPCPHHGYADNTCGGCPWQFMNYSAQLRAKGDRVAAVLGKLDPDFLVLPIQPSPTPFAYRNRAQLKTDGQRLGFVSAGAHSIVDVQRCAVLNAHNEATLKSLRQRLPRPEWRPARGRSWTTLDIDDDVNADTVAVNERRPFRQGNSAQNSFMREWLRTQLAADASEGTMATAPGPALELFAGSGNFTEILAAAGCATVTALDSFEPAIAALNARALPGVTGLCRNLDAVDWDPARDATLAQALASAQLLLLDPPRTGFKNLAAYLAAGVSLQTLLYVSCDLASFARDAQAVLQAGFVLTAVQPVDLFPQTPHVEILTRFERRT